MFNYFFICCALFLSLFAQSATPTQFDSIKYATPHVLERPITLLQDEQQQLWLLTEQGISLLNGATFVSYRSYQFAAPLSDGLMVNDTLILATQQQLFIDQLANTDAQPRPIWQSQNNEKILKLQHSGNAIYWQTNQAIYQAQLQSTTEPQLRMQLITKLSSTKPSLIVAGDDLLLIANNGYHHFTSSTNQWLEHTSKEQLKQLKVVASKLYLLTESGDLFVSPLYTNQSPLTKLGGNIQQLLRHNATLYVKQNNLLVDIAKPDTSKTQLPLGASQVHLDRQGNIWGLSDYDIQVKWAQPITLQPMQTPNQRSFSLSSDNFALQQDKLFQRTDNDNWRLRTRLTIAANSQQVFETDSKLWLVKPDRLVAIDKKTFVTSLNITLDIDDLVLPFSDHSVLIVRQQNVISVNANGLQTILTNDCSASCLPSYQINSQTISDGVLWLATNRGLHTFDLATFQFSEQRLDRLNAVSPVLQTAIANDNHIWLVYPNKIALFNAKQGTSKIFFSPDNRLLQAEATDAGALKVMTQQGWFLAQPSALQAIPSTLPELVLHQASLHDNAMSYLAPNQVLNLKQTEEELRLAFNLSKQHPQQNVYFRFKYQDEQTWSETASFSQSLTLKNLRQGHNELHLQARLEGSDWQTTRRFIYDMPYEYLQTKWVIIYSIGLFCLALMIYGFERYKRFRMMFDSLKQQSFISSLLESTKDGVWVANKDREIQSINAAFQEITGFNDADVVGKGFHIFSDQVRNHEVESIIWQQVTKSGFWTGEVWSSRKDGQPISIDLSVTRVETSNKFGSKTDVKFVGVFSDVTIRKNSEKTMRQLATRDPLTDFANRTLFIELLERAIATANPQKPDFAIVIIDLDNFSKVNANLGPLRGDELIKLVALRLNNDLDKGISIARLSGDEFALLIPNHLFIGEPEFYIRKIAGQVKRKLSSTFMLGKTEVNISASLGAAFYPHHGLNPETLMRCADTALKKVKSAGKNNVCIYESAIDDTKAELLTLESELIRAFDNDEFSVNYQPKYKIQQHAISGFEALVRWNNPQRGEVLPDQFIPLAEQNGLIRQLDTAVLKKVCLQIQQWQQQHFDFGHVAINISALNFQQMEFCQSIKQITSDFAIDPICIELEITESAMMSDPEQTHDNLLELKRLGFTIALDDFGTGHSSLGHLKHFPIDRIKIDRSFIKDIEFSEQDKNIVSVIIQLAKFLEIKVVSEGVENQRQAYILHVLGCNDIQGYMISKALPPAQIDDFLREKFKKIPDVAENQ